MSQANTKTVRRALREAIEFNFARIYALAPLLDQEHALETRRRQERIARYKRTLRALRRRRRTA